MNHSTRTFSPNFILLFLVLFLFSPMLVFARPSQIIDGGFFYFPPTKSLITIGGWGPPDWEPVSNVWSLSSTGWSEMPMIPEGITHTAAAFDEANDRFIVMGGASPDQSTWSFDGSTWTKVADPLTSGYGFDPEIIYDPTTQDIVCYFAAMSWNPGEDSSSETYILGDSGWVKQTVDPAPGGYADVGFVYDSAHQEAVWFNGSETWIWNNGGWIKKQPISSPALEFGQFAMAYDAARGETIVYGRGETWAWDGSNWSRKNPPQSPDTPERGFFAFGYDANRQVIVLFGGEVVVNPDTYETIYLDDLWEWNGQTWNKFEESTGIPNWSLY